MKFPMLKVRWICILGAVLLGCIANAQVSQDSDLFKTLKAKDSLIFNEGFNQCDLAQIELLLPRQFEFYHDKNGIIRSREDFIKTLKENLCSSGNNTAKRILEKSSLEVFPLYEDGKLYGAIQAGRHSFGNVKARFTNLWLLEHDEWMPSRMISYDHQMKAASVTSDVTFIELPPNEISTYLGKYQFSPDFVLTIVREGNQLYGDTQGQKVEINPIGEHQFLDESQKMKLHFVVAENGKITGLEMTGPSGKMNAQRINQ